MSSRKLIDRFPALFWSPEEFDSPDTGAVIAPTATVLRREDLPPAAAKVDTAAYLRDFFKAKLGEEVSDPPKPVTGDVLVVGGEDGEPEISIGKVGNDLIKSLNAYAEEKIDKSLFVSTPLIGGPNLLKLFGIKPEDVPQAEESEGFVKFEDLELTHGEFKQLTALAKEIEKKTGHKPDIVALGKSAKEGTPYHHETADGPINVDIQKVGGKSTFAEDVEWVQKKLMEGLQLTPEMLGTACVGTGKSMMAFEAAANAAKNAKNGKCSECFWFEHAIMDPLSGKPVHVECTHEKVSVEFATEKFIVGNKVPCFGFEDASD